MRQAANTSSARQRFYLLGFQSCWSNQQLWKPGLGTFYILGSLQVRFRISGKRDVLSSWVATVVTSYQAAAADIWSNQENVPQSTLFWAITVPQECSRPGQLDSLTFDLVPNQLTDCCPRVSFVWITCVHILSNSSLPGCTFCIFVSFLFCKVWKTCLFHNLWST